MALVKCPDCGKEFSNSALQCPNCGYRNINSKPQNKKTFIWIAIVIGIFFILRIIAGIMHSMANAKMVFGD